MKRRILVVDDHERIADSLARWLTQHGHDVRTATGGFRAIEVAENFHPDIVLLDIELPKLNGYEIARQIRRQAWSGGTLLIATTGWADDEQVRLIRESGFNGHLVKPFDYAELTALLTGIIPCGSATGLQASAPSPLSVPPERISSGKK
jgi:DNA-binding response OmpR family regulator